MNDTRAPLSPLQKAAVAIKSLRARAEAAEKSRTAPIAIIGLACRLPAQGETPEALWSALESGRTGSIEVPRERWDIDAVYDPEPGRPGKMYVRNACFIDQVDLFDPLFFRISPREAVGIDPQQRLLLEVVHEALEDAGLPPASLAGTRTGVFLGISTNDYSALLSRTVHGSGSNAVAGAGNAASVASGRISYTFGFQGPCFAVDTACSSSLVTTHLAVQSLRHGESDVALVCGVNLMLTPDIAINFCQGRMLSPDGLCKTFDAAADGYVRGEGCGVVVLKRLDDALAAGDRVVAVISGSAINQDGKSAGLTAPNGAAQVSVIRQALANAGLQADEIDFIEAHGTGTALGDPIEMHALRDVFAGRERPLGVGSVKASIGHTEAAAGVSGLIKAALMLRHQAVPPHPSFQTLNPHIDLGGLEIDIARRLESGPLRHVGVSSFGFSGTNAHVIVSAPPVAASPVEGPLHASDAEPTLLITAQSKAALEELIGRYRALLQRRDVSFSDLCFSAQVERARYKWWVVAKCPEDLFRAEPSNEPLPKIPPQQGRRVSLPKTPFERKRYWIETDQPAVVAVEAPVARPPLQEGVNPLLGRKITLPLSDEIRFESSLCIDLPGLEFLADHHVSGRIVVPAAAMLDMAAGARPGFDICDLALVAPLVLAEGGSRNVQLICDAQLRFRIASYDPQAPEDAQLHATGVFAPANPGGHPGLLPAETGEKISGEQFYEALARYGVAYGPSFRRLQEISGSGGIASARLVQTQNDAVAQRTTAIDAALQLVAAALDEASDDVMLPARMGRVSLHRLPKSDARVTVKAKRNGAQVEAQVEVVDRDGLAIAMDGVVFRAASARSDHGFYQIAWREAPQLTSLLAPFQFQSASELTARLADDDLVRLEREAVSDYESAEAELNGLATAFAVAALERLGLQFEPGLEGSMGALGESLGIADHHSRLFSHLIGFLVEDGIMERSGRRWRVIAAPRPASLDVEGLIARHPALAAEITVLARCGMALDKVLTGETDPLTLLFGGEDAGAGSFYTGSGYADTVNALVESAIGALARSLDPTRPIRVVEVGAGTGGTTRAALKALDARPVIYDFTDISPAFLAAARQAFQKEGFRTRRLDIEADPTQQDFEAGSADIVIAANVLHATADIAQSLEHARKLLAPGGMLLLVESTQARRWVDIVFGLTKGWWRFQDTRLRPAHPLLSGESWADVLREAGFEPGVSEGIEVILARKPMEAAPRALNGEGIAVSGYGDDAFRRRIAAAGVAISDIGSEAHRIHILPPTECREDAQVALFADLCDVVAELARRSPMPRLTLIGRDDAGHGGLAGFVRSLRLEHPDCRPRLILTNASASAMADDAALGDGEEEVLYKDGRRLVARIAPMADTRQVPVDGTWLISGGAGGLGRAIAAYLAERGASRLVLLGRREPGDLPDFGVPCEFHAGDVADSGFIRGVMERIGDVAGVVHAAGLLSNAPIVAQTPDTAARVLHGKVGGAIALHEAVRDLASRGKPVEHFVLFSTAAGILGSARQSNHAFAGSFLDRFAEQRRAQGLPALAIDWGVWREIGAAARLGFDAQSEELGLGSIEPAAGVKAFGAALATKGAHLLVTPGADFGKIAGHFKPGAPRLYADMIEAATPFPRQPEREQAGGAATAPAHAAPAGEGILDGLSRIVADLLQIDSVVDTSLPLFEYGLDSLVAVEIKNRAEKELGLAIQVRDLIEGASIEQIAASVAPAKERSIGQRERLFAIIGELLELTTPIDPDTPLFEYGLDSLVAVEIKNRVEKELGIALQVRDMIEGASAGALAQAINAPAVPDKDPPRRISPDPAHRHEPFPLTEIQQAYWLGRRDDMSFGSIGCYLYTEFDSNQIDLARLEEAWNRLVLRHDMLRLVIGADGTQRILESVPRYRFHTNDLRGLPADECERELARIRKELSGRVAAPESWPLFDVSVTLHGDLARIHAGFDLIALDAASIHALRLEWGRLYDDPTAELAPIGLSFRDVVTESVEYRRSEAFARSEGYWLARVDTLPDAPDLPLLERSDKEKPRFRRHRIVLAKEQADRLKAACRARKLTLAGVLAAAYADILAGWSRDPRFSLTVTSFNRPDLHPDIAALLGDFTSTLLLEVDARAERFEDRARMLAERLAADLDHADVGGVQVLRERSKRRGGAMSNVPVVFTSALGFRDAAGRNAERSDAVGWDRLGTTVYNVSSTPQVWIDHQISEEDGQLFCNWDVLEGLFPDGVIQAMTGAHERLLGKLADGAAWEWPLRRALPEMPRAPVLATPAPEMLHDRFCRRAMETPEAIAILASDRSLTYGELQRAAAHLARRLARELNGADQNRDRLVAITLEKGWRQVVAVLGSVMSGAAYLPIDPAWPQERRTALIGQSEALLLDPIWIDEAVASDEALDIPGVVDPKRLAYVIYTSGSTGVPKGVMIEHRSAFATIEAVNRRWNLTAHDRTFALSSLSFDLSVFDIFGPLSVGGAIVMPPAFTQPDPAHWSRAVEDGGVTVWNSAPALMALMLEHGLPARNQIRLVMLSGDWIALDVVPKLREQAPAAQLVSLGGATEAAIWSNFHEVDELDPAWRSIPYGTPLDGQNLHVVGRNGADLPDWTIGDIEISGVGLARGYLGDPARTAERFRIDADSGERRYRTGDIGRHRPYGAQDPAAPVPIEFLGREDFQVKIQGHRIELGEIEAVLEQHPRIAHAVANAFPVGTGREKVLAAYVVPEDGASIDLPYESAVAAARADAAAGRLDFDAEAFERNAAFLTRQTAAAVAAACRSLAGSSEFPDAETLISRHGVKERYRDWLTRTLALVRSEGGEQMAPQSIHDLPEPGHFALGAAELDLLDRSIADLGDILTEKKHSADIYLSAQTPEVYGHLFATPNRLIAAIVAELTTGRALRILEVGGGLGTTLSQLSEVVAGSGSHYRFTDASPGMLGMARSRFGSPDWLSFGLLDMNAPPEADAERFDVIVATSALHVAKDMAQAIAGLRKRLRPGGILVAFEQTRFFPWYDLSMGLQSGFDARTDHVRRPHHPLMKRGEWATLLAEVGFVDVEIPVAEGSLDDRLGFDVIVARAPDAASSGAVEPDALRQWLASRLPGYMVPRHIALIDRLPLSANGKIDRSALRPPVAGSAGGGERADNSLIAEVSELVASCLGVEQVDPGKSLFELGATSLSIVAIQRRIGDRYGRSVPLQAIFEQPTLDQLVNMIAGDAAPTSAVIRFASHRPGDLRPRLIMMPGILALPFYLRELATLLAPEIELLSIQLPGLFADEVPLDTIEDQVDYVVGRIRQAQPKGPYFLGGHSYGGTVAFETARRLRLEGEDVPLVILADTVRTRTKLEDFQRDDIATMAMVRALMALYGDRLDAEFLQVATESLEGQDPGAALDRLTNQLAEKRIFGPIALPVERMAAMFKANFRALGQFEAKSLPGDLALIRTDEGFPIEFREYEPEETLADPTLGWGDVVAGDIALSSVPGDHLSLMAPGTLGPTAEIILDLVRKAAHGERRIATEGAIPAASSLLVDPLERLAFRMMRHALRTEDSGNARVALPPVNAPEKRLRRSVRRYAPGRSPTLASLAVLLSSMVAIEGPEGPLYQYPSAGSAYPVQVWLHLKPGCADVGEGLYAYHPERHDLELVDSEVAFPISGQAETNRLMAETASFAIYLVVAMEAIEPLYGDLSRDFSLIEAGAMTQLMMEYSAEAGLGLCPIGALDAGDLARALGLGETRFVALMLAGGVPD